MVSQAYFLSPVSSLPAISEALTAEAENGNRAAVKTKMDKCFIVSYPLNRMGVRGGYQRPSEQQTALGLLEFR